MDVVGLGLTHVWRGAGCQSCRFTGYRGRTGVFEIIETSEPVRNLIAPHTNSATIERAAREAERKAVEAIPADENAIRAAAEALGAAAAESGLLRARMRAEVWLILTKEHQAKALQLEAQRAEQMAQMRERIWDTSV